MKIKECTVVIKYTGDETPEGFTLGSKVLGGTVIAMAAYDAISVADRAIEIIEFHAPKFMDEIEKMQMAGEFVG